MNERVLTLRDSIVKITQMLSGKSIQVTQSGVNAYVKSDYMGRPTLVNLPYLPDNATDELCNAIQGFLDHEVAHILFSDFHVLGVAAKLGVHPMMNILEDARVEKRMAAKFTGCGHNLRVTGEFFLSKYTTPMMNEAIISKDADKLIGVLIVPLIRALSGQSIYKEFMKDKASYVATVMKKIADLEPRIESAKSSQDCLDLAVEIEKRLNDEKPKSEGKEVGDKGKGKDKSDKHTKAPKPAKATKSEKSEEPEDEEEPEEGVSSSEEGEGGGGDGEKEGEKSEKEPEAKDEGDEPKFEPAEEESEDDEGDEGEASIPEEESEESLGGETGSESTPGDAKSDPSDVMKAIDKENASSFTEKMSKVISEETLESMKTAKYTVYSKDNDLVEPFKIGKGFDSKMFTDLASKVDHMVGPLQKDLERAIAARSMAVWANGKHRGRLHAANLSRLAVGDDRVFRQRQEAYSKDVAVELVIDASGSMSGEKIHLAAQSAYALSQVLERIGIKHEVICFTTGNGRGHGSGSVPGSHAEISASEEMMGKGYSRSEALYMPILKGFNERLTTDVRNRFGWLPNSRILANNVDGECVEIAAHRLSQRREGGKVMIVLSDGLPSANGDSIAMRQHLKEVVEAVTKKGTKIVGIGIQSEAVTKFYPKNVVINEVVELPDRVIKELRHMLIQ